MTFDSYSTIIGRLEKRVRDEGLAPPSFKVERITITQTDVIVYGMVYSDVVSKWTPATLVLSDSTTEFSEVW